MFKFSSFTCLFYMKQQHTTLDKLAVGCVAYIHDYSDEAIALQLMGMGCLPGEKIVVKQVSVAGGTIAVSVLGSLLGLRKNEAEKIIIRLE